MSRCCGHQNGYPRPTPTAFFCALRGTQALTARPTGNAWYGLAIMAAGTENVKEVGRALRRVFALEPDRRTEALADEAFEPVRQSAEWRELFPAAAKPAGSSMLQGAARTRE